MRYFRKFDELLFFLLSFLFVSISSNYGQNRTVSAELQVSSSAINRFISSQTLPTLTGTYSGYSYNISITTPVIQLNTNSATVQFTILAKTSIGDYSFTVQPTITIPNLNVSLSQITALLQQFDSLINSRTDIPAWLKPIIISGYNNLNLTIYPSKVIDYANSAVPAFTDIQVTDIGLSFAVIPNAIKFTISATVHGVPPVFSSQWMKRGPWLLSIRFGASVATTVKQVTVYNGAGIQIYSNTGLNLAIDKGGISGQIDLSNIAVTSYYVTVLFHSSYGEYARVFAFIFDTATYNTWFNSSQTASLN